MGEVIGGWKRFVAIAQNLFPPVIITVILGVGGLIIGVHSSVDHIQDEIDVQSLMLELVITRLDAVEANLMSSHLAGDEENKERAKFLLGILERITICRTNIAAIQEALKFKCKQPEILLPQR